MTKGKLKTFKQFTSESLQMVHGTQLGSNKGGIHTDSSGGRYYVKHYKDPEQAKVEALTGRIYAHMGIHTVHPEYRDVNGKPSVVSRFDDDLKKMRPAHFEHLTSSQASDVGKMYHAAILTKNWDIVGLEHDNILQHAKTGNLHAVDTGGAFHYRAQGSLKDFGPDIDEHQSLRIRNKQTSHVFNRVFSQHPHAERDGIEAVRALDDETIEKEFKNSGLKNWKELHTNFQARKKSLLAKY